MLMSNKQTPERERKGLRQAPQLQGQPQHALSNQNLEYTIRPFDWVAVCEVLRSDDPIRHRARGNPACSPQCTCYAGLTDSADTNMQGAHTRFEQDLLVAVDCRRLAAEY